MFSELKNLFRHSFIYAFGSAIQSFVAFILIPIYTRFLSIEEYGAFEIAGTFLTVIVFLLSLGFASAILKNYNLDFRGKKEDQKNLIGTAFLFIVPLVFGINIVLWLIAPAISQIIFGTETFVNLIKLSILLSVFAILLNMCFAILRAKEKSKQYTFYFLLRFCFLLVFNIYFVVIRKEGVDGILLGNLIAHIIVFLSMIPLIYKSANIHISKFYIVKLLAFGIPLIPASMAQWFMDLSDRYFLRFYTSLEEVGIYSLGYKIGIVVFIALVAPFQLAWPTVSFKLAKHKQVKKIYSKVLTYFVMIIGSFALLLSVFANEIITIFATENYVRSADIVWIVAFSYVIFGAHYVIAPGIHLAGKTHLYPWLLIFPAGANIVLNYFFVERYGMFGAAYTTLFSFIAVFVLTYALSNTLYPVRYEAKRIMILTILFAGVLITNHAILFDQMIISIAFKSGLMICFLFLLFIFKFFHKNEIDALRNIFRSRLHFKQQK